MKSTRYILPLIGLWLTLMVGFVGNVYAQPIPTSEQLRQRNIDAGFKFNECVFLVSNYSCLNKFSTETASVAELLNQEVEGFYFYLLEDKVTKQPMVRKPDGSFIPLKGILEDIRKSLDERPLKMMTLFLDFNVELNLQETFDATGLTDYLFIYGDRTNDWPAMKEMMSNGKRVVAFDVQRHVGSPEWLLPMSEFVEHTDPDWGNAQTSVETAEEKLKRNLTLFTRFKNLEAQYSGEELDELSRHTTYMIDLLKDQWMGEGRLPNFIVTDKLDIWQSSIMQYMRNINQVYGTVVSGKELVNYINWEGMNNATAGVYCFPLEAGIDLMLSPLIPGYEVQPEKLYASGSQRITTMPPFKATPVGIDKGLEFYLPFNGEVSDASLHQRPVGIQQVEIDDDVSRGQTALFGNGSRLNLPTPQEMGMRDHDFTVQAWLMVPKLDPEKRDYCVLGSRTSAYQQSLHLMIRRGKPYMGFFNNDISGKTEIEPNKWYNLIWRYNKQNGEMAIFVNGKLDAIATGRPGFLGSDSLYVGYAGFNEESYFNGMIDKLAIWSRVLSDKEILGLSNQVIEVQVTDQRNYWYSYGWVVALLLALILAGVLIYGRKRKHRSTILGDEPEYLGNEQELLPTDKAIPETNCIRVFGHFLVVDKNGEDITSLFTPKLKRLFILLLLNSSRGKKGITGNEMNDYIWGKDSKNVKSVRSVSVLKLRKILERLDKVEIAYRANKYAIVVSGPVYCDYMQCLGMLDNKHIHNRQEFERFFEIVQRGEVFEDESFDWLDDAKGYVSNSAVDVMAHFISTYHVPEDADTIIHIANKMLVNDPCNEEALQFMIKAMISQNNIKQAHYAYDSFCAEYQKSYGETFKTSFEELCSE